MILTSGANADGKFCYHIYNADMKLIRYSYWTFAYCAEPSISAQKLLSNLTMLKDLKRVSHDLGQFIDLELFRVDLYWYKEKWYGGEITLCPGGGSTLFCKLPNIYSSTYDPLNPDYL
jgi:hypothetical protein